MKKQDWVWMPHPGHFICGMDCRFRLNTYVGGYIVSTVGELLFDSATWDITAARKGIILKGRGDDRRNDYLKRVGWEEIGYGRKYETMVFPARKSVKNSCCPWEMADGSKLDMKGYNTAEDAFKGHMTLCKKWAKKNQEER